METIKTKTNKTPCPYCGEAPVNHTLYYLENMIQSLTDTHMTRVARHAPKFIKSFASFIPVVLFNTLVDLNLGRFSADIDKAASYRSQIIWEEAKKRGIDMEQIVIGDKYLDWYRARINGKTIYFESIPIQPEYLDFKKDWDNKIVLKKELLKNNIPAPRYAKVSPFSFVSLKKIFARFTNPVIVKPQSGSRARHTVTNINSLEHFKKGIKIARQISGHLIVEEHLDGYICRATLVGGVLAGFYSGSVASVVGDGGRSIRQLIEDKNKSTIDRYHVHIDKELYDSLERSGYSIDDILPIDKHLTLSHRRGQLFGGHTKEMIDDLHPSFIAILEKAAFVVDLPVVGFDCIIPDPTEDASSQRWGIIECNTLPFIDMHYYALEGKPRNIAGMIWDLWV